MSIENKVIIEENIEIYKLSKSAKKTFNSIVQKYGLPILRKPAHNLQLHYLISSDISIKGMQYISSQDYYCKTQNNIDIYFHKK